MNYKEDAVFQEIAVWCHVENPGRLEDHAQIRSLQVLRHSRGLAQRVLE
jgi:hypothetical protein